MSDDQTSRTVVATRFGGPEVLAIVDRELPAPGPGEVRIEVRAIGTNPFDVKMYRGLMRNDPALLPMSLGAEASGVVTAVGPDAVGPDGPLHPGDEVVIYRIGDSYSTAVVAPASSVLPKPDSLSFDQAAGMMVTGTTAVHAVTVTGVSRGETVIVHGAAGGVGLMTVQLAVGLGARVIGTASEGRHDLLRGLGAEPTAYGPGLLDRLRTLAPQGADAAIDAVGSDEAVDTSLALVADAGRIATIAAFQRGLELGFKVLGGAPGADNGAEIRTAARLDLVRLAAKGDLTVHVGATYPLEEVADAHRLLAGGHAQGKVILVP